MYIKEKMRKHKAVIFTLTVIVLILAGSLTVSANEDDGDLLPGEYGDFIGSLDDGITDLLPDGLLSDSSENINGAADELAQPTNILSILIKSFAEGLTHVVPTLALLLGTVILSAIVSTVAGNTSLSRPVEICTRLCSFCAIIGTTVRCVETLSQYFERLFAAVASFIPVSAALFAMGGNINTAVSGIASLGVILTVCEFFCTQTAIPIFCISLSLSALSVFDGAGSAAGGAVSAAIRRWYMIALSFVMMILTVSLSSSTLLAAKADNVAMRGAKFAVSSFIPITGGTLSSTLGTLASSVELLRGSVGTVGIFVLILILLPCVIELALMRAVFAISGFCASSLGCASEARLLNELDSLYGYLEGVAALSSAVFMISLAIFSSISTPFS
jgi:stage III sporulation protein AE